MNNLTAIILTKNEQLHIRRCLENISPVCDKVYVVDCYSTDDTVKICRNFANVEVVQREWPGNHALQFNWALDNLEICTEWVIRMDADEYFLDGEAARLLALLPALPDGKNALSLSRARYFMGKRLTYGGTDFLSIVRVFRKGKARSEVRVMDETIVVTEGESIETNIKFADNNLQPLSWWISKHLDYARKEADMQLHADLAGQSATSSSLSSSGRNKRKQKQFYYRLPLFWRAFAYFFYRYILRLGFLDGKVGFIWHFMHAWWYRSMVDALLVENNMNCCSYGNGKRRSTV